MCLPVLPSVLSLTAFALPATAEGSENASDAFSIADIVESVEADVLDFAKKSARAPETVRDHLEAFATAVNWKEPWLRSLLAGHIALWILFVTTRRKPSVQLALFVTVTGLVAVAEPLNTYCRSRWRDFATQNYFDERGVFAGTIYCAPLLALGMVMMFNFLIQAAHLLVQVKRCQITQELKQKAAKSKKDE